VLQRLRIVDDAAVHHAHRVAEVRDVGERIFKNPMTTAAAIDRLVHHSVILEFAVPSYRTGRAGKPSDSPPDPTSGSKAKKKVK
jgi:hypothetical protein